MHESFVKTIRRISKSNWGSEYKSSEDAAKALAGKGWSITDAAIVEIVRRLNVVVDALARDDQNDRSQQEDENFKVRPDGAKAFPGIKIGDILYGDWSIEDGVSRYVVVSVQEGDFCQIVMVDPWSPKIRAYWVEVDAGLFRTEAEAIREGVTNIIKYHKLRLQFAERALRAVETGEDLTPFVNGMGYEDEES